MIKRKSARKSSRSRTAARSRRRGARRSRRALKGGVVGAPALQHVLRPLVAMYRSAGALLLATLRDSTHDDFSRFTRHPNKNIFVGDRDFCFPYKELMRIDNYIARLVRRSEGSDGPRIQELLSEISDFKRKYAGELAELERHCSTTRARDNNTGGTTTMARSVSEPPPTPRFTTTTRWMTFNRSKNVATEKDDK